MNTYILQIMGLAGNIEKMAIAQANDPVEAVDKLKHLILYEGEEGEEPEGTYTDAMHLEYACGYLCLDMLSKGEQLIENCVNGASETSGLLLEVSGAQMRCWGWCPQMTLKEGEEWDLYDALTGDLVEGEGC